jgi:hypothetical protein
MKMKIMKQKINNWIPFPREYADQVTQGILNKNELLLLCWIRLHSNPYGIWRSANHKAIKEDLFPKCAINYVNKLFLSLKKKRFVHYKERSGRRGSFEVHIDDLWLPSGEIKRLDKYFEKSQVRGGSSELPENNTNLSQSLATQSQRLQIQKDGKKTITNKISISPKVRGNNNDIDTNKYKENIDVDSLKSKEGRVQVVEFKPNSDEEAWCKRIALEIGEEHMNFILSAKNKHGIGLIKTAYGIYKEVESTKHIDNPRAYLNRIIKNLADKRNKPPKSVDLRG